MRVGQDWKRPLVLLLIVDKLCRFSKGNHHQRNSAPFEF